MKKCAKACLLTKEECEIKECRYWIDSEKNQNCTFIAIDKNGPMTLRQIAEIEKITHVAVRNIQNKAMKKLVEQIKKDEYI